MPIPRLSQIKNQVVELLHQLGGQAKTSDIHKHLVVKVATHASRAFFKKTPLVEFIIRNKSIVPLQL